MAWYLPMGWDEYRRLSRWDRRQLLDSLNEQIDAVNQATEAASLNGRPPRRER